MTIEQTGVALRAGKTSCVELTDQALSKVEQLNPKLNAFITVTADSARAQARQLDRELAQGLDRGPLHGIPIAHKDLIYTRGVRTTCGSKVFENFVPDHDAPVVEMLNGAGAVMIGKLGLHECAYGVTSTNPHFGAVRNPCDAECIPGGSSGGSGAAVATGMVFMATGTDTGGSIRIPAAYCGTAGLKPTYGLVDRRGVQPLGLSLDHVGPLARTVRDIELVMQVLGPLPMVPTAELRIGVPENYYFEKLDPEVKSAVERAATYFDRVESVRVPDIDALNTVARVILLAEASAVYEKYLDQPQLFGPDVFALFQQGLMIRGTEYVNAQRIRKQLIDEFRKVFDKVDILLTPTIPIVAPRIGEKTVEVAGEPMDTRLATTRFVRGINPLGLPALAVPCGKSKSGLPISAQLVGRAFEDAAVLRAGAILEAGILSLPA